MYSNISLNQNQAKAVNHKSGPMMVVAGPGSGKTTVITHRVKTLINTHNVDPNEILVITFAKAAADEMKKRFQKLAEGTMEYGANNVTFSTFHSFFFRIIRQSFGYGLENVLSEENRREVVRAAVAHLKIGTEEGDDFLQSVLNEISLVKNELIDINYHNPIDLPTDSFRQIAKIYEEWKDENNKIDFDDMLAKCYELINENEKELNKWRNRYKYIMIDEFQDINRVQYETIKLITKPLENIFIVGDDDQSIYRFRGSRPEFLLNFKTDFPTTQNIVLSTNYRSTDNIIRICNSVISENQNRFPKQIIGTDTKGKRPIMLNPNDAREEALMISDKIKKMLKTINPSDIAVVYRTNIQSRPLIDAFMDTRIPFHIKDDAPGIYEHWIAKDICAYFSLALDRQDDTAFIRIANKPKRYISKAAIALARKDASKSDFGVLSALYDDNTRPLWQRTRLEEFMFYLNALKTRTAYDAIKYLRQAIGYDGYLNEYAEYRNMNSKGLFEILRELQEAAKGYENIESYITHVNEVVEKIKQDKLAKKKNIVTADAVTLSTMHGVKGLEYETVFVTSLVEGILPHEKSKTPAQLEEECRMLYVAMTRAKANLYISHIKTRNEIDAVKSRYLESIDSSFYKKG